MSSNTNVCLLFNVETWCLAALIKYLPDRYLSWSFLSSSVAAAYFGNEKFTMSPTLISVVPGTVISMIRLFAAMC